MSFDLRSFLLCVLVFAVFLMSISLIFLTTDMLFGKGGFLQGFLECFKQKRYSEKKAVFSREYVDEKPQHGCVDCEHFNSGVIYQFCASDLGRKPKYHRITGEVCSPELVLCLEARANERLCGLKGRFFNPKEGSK